MPPVPILKPREVVKAFENLGWEVAQQRGSHIILTKEGEPATLSVPNHSEVARGTLRSLGRFLSLLRWSCATLQVAVELRSNKSKIKFKACGYSTD